jgi:hypothetical protein
LANHADSRGRGAYAGQKLLAGYARKSDRSVRNDLGALLERGLIRPGDQSIAGHIPADCRPVVYDLALERKQASARKHSSARQQASAATSDHLTESRAPDQEEHRGSGSVLPLGSQVPAGSEEPRERKQASYKPTDNQEKNSPTESSEGGVGGTTARPRRKAPAAGADFERWYAAYPVHKARGDAEKAWGQMTRAGADPEVLIAAAKRYCDDPQVRRGFGKYPAGWLRAKCWLDEATPEPGVAGNGHRPSTTDQRVAQAEALKERRRQRESGPAPQNVIPGSVIE